MVENCLHDRAIEPLPGMIAHKAGAVDQEPVSPSGKIRQPHQTGYSLTPSSSIDSCDGLRLTLPSFAAGQTNRPRSSRFVNRQAPWLSHQMIFKRSPRRPLKTNIWPEYGSSCAFRGMWALISRDVGHAFHAIVGSHFTIVGRLADTFIDSGWSGLVKRFHDGSASSEAIA